MIPMRTPVSPRNAFIPWTGHCDCSNAPEGMRFFQLATGRQTCWVVCATWDKIKQWCAFQIKRCPASYVIIFHSKAYLRERCAVIGREFCLKSVVQRYSIGWLKLLFICPIIGIIMKCLLAKEREKINDVIIDWFVAGYFIIQRHKKYHISFKIILHTRTDLAV